MMDTHCGADTQRRYQLPSHPPNLQFLPPIFRLALLPRYITATPSCRLLKGGEGWSLSARALSGREGPVGCAGFCKELSKGN